MHQSRHRQALWTSFGKARPSLSGGILYSFQTYLDIKSSFINLNQGEGQENPGLPASHLTGGKTQAFPQGGGEPG